MVAMQEVIRVVTCTYRIWRLVPTIKDSRFVEMAYRLTCQYFRLPDISFYQIIGSPTGSNCPLRTNISEKLSQPCPHYCLLSIALTGTGKTAHIDIGGPAPRRLWTNCVVPRYFSTRYHSQESPTPRTFGHAQMTPLFVQPDSIYPRSGIEISFRNF